LLDRRNSKSPLVNFTLKSTFSKYIISSSVVIFLTTLLFSCTNKITEVRDFLADKNLPIGAADHISMIYKDSGNITTKMTSPLLLDFSNREEHPYTEFPEGIHITKIYNTGDSLTVDGNYSISYSKTNVSELKEKVVIINHKEKYTLKTSQIFWDQKYHYYITEKPFVFITPTDTLEGEGIEATENLKKWHIKNNSGVLQVNESIDTNVNLKKE